MENLDDHFLAQLASSCRLTAFHVGELIAQDKAPHWRGKRLLIEARLDGFFRHCTHLEELPLCCLRKDDKLPASLFKLPRLRVLLLNSSVILQHPELKSLSSLKSLSIETSDLDYQQLSSLVHLTRFTCLDLPGNMLVDFEGPPAFTFSLLPSLESLKVGFHRAPFNDIFSLVSQCLRLKRLHLIQCEKQERLLDDIAEVLLCLEDLTFTYCASLTDITEDFAALTSLKSLRTSCYRLAKLPNGAGNLSALKTLVQHPLAVKRLPTSFCQLSSLETFCIMDCPNLDSLPEGFGCLTSLKCLQLVESPQLELPEDIGQLTNLHTVGLRSLRIFVELKV